MAMLREQLASAYGGIHEFDINEDLAADAIIPSPELDELNERIGALFEVIPDPLETPTLYYQPEPARKNAIIIENVIENFDEIRQRSLEVMWHGFLRALETEQKLEEMELLNVERKVDMPVAGSGINEYGMALTEVHVSLDNELDDPSKHAEAGVLADLGRQRANLKEKYYPDAIMNMTQEQCFGCTGVMYFNKPGGTVIGSRNADVPSVNRLYTPNKRTIIGVSTDAILGGYPTYAEPFILDMGLVAFQAALHLGLGRDPYNNKLSLRSTEQTLEELRHAA